MPVETDSGDLIQASAEMLIPRNKVCLGQLHIFTKTFESRTSYNKTIKAPEKQKPRQ